MKKQVTFTIPFLHPEDGTANYTKNPFKKVMIEVEIPDPRLSTAMEVFLGEGEREVRVMLHFKEIFLGEDAAEMLRYFIEVNCTPELFTWMMGTVSFEILGEHVCQLSLKNAEMRHLFVNKKVVIIDVTNLKGFEMDYIALANRGKGSLLNYHP